RLSYYPTQLTRPLLPDTLSLHDALPISAPEHPAHGRAAARRRPPARAEARRDRRSARVGPDDRDRVREGSRHPRVGAGAGARPRGAGLPQGAAAARRREELAPPRAAARDRRVRRGYGVTDHRRMPE